jgi:curved DNA-binding protein CbpA
VINKYFDILGIPPTKDETVIKKAYRKKAKQYHPDRNPDNPKAHDYFLVINKAYEIILEYNERKGLAQQEHHNTKKGTHRKRSSESISKEEALKERMRMAKIRYEKLRKQEEQENAAYYKKITSGPLWNYFIGIVFTSTFLASLFIIDHYLLPSRWEKSSVIYQNNNVQFSGIVHNSIIPIYTKNNASFWIDANCLSSLIEDPNVLLEKSLLFKDVKQIWFWDFSNWKSSKTDFSLSGTFPIIPILLFIPLLTYYLRKKPMIYSLLFMVSTYFYSIVLIILLIANDRWLHLITLGLL